jgi:hypothetical protein
LPVHNLIGTALEPIVIQGPLEPGRAIFLARPGANTVSIIDSAYLRIGNLILDGQGLPVDAVKAEGHSRWAHHIDLDGLTIINHGNNQQNSGISTKCPAWGWIVRANRIVGAGTGMYFGDSDGSDPFFASIVENNRVINPIGYCMQIKHQVDRPALPDVPTDPAVTLIRRNVFIKSRDGSTGVDARPNLLVGHWPLTGPGAHDRYLIYGNLLYDNPNEALFQGEGNFALYNNLLLNPNGEAVRIRPHNHRPRDIAVFQNTVVARGVGISLTGVEPGYERRFEKNLVAGSPPLSGEITGDNRVSTFERAPEMWLRPLAEVDGLDLSPARDVFAAAVPLPAMLLQLPGSGQDYLGQKRLAAGYGACLPAVRGSAACR